MEKSKQSHLLTDTPIVGQKTEIKTPKTKKPKSIIPSAKKVNALNFSQLRFSFFDTFHVYFPAKLNSTIALIKVPSSPPSPI